MKLVVATQDDQIVNVEVDPGTEVENLKAILQAETDIPTDDQVLMASGKIIQSGTLSGNGVGDNDVVMLMRKPPGAGAGAGAAVSGASNPTAVDPSTSGTSKEIPRSSRRSPACFRSCTARS